MKRTFWTGMAKDASGDTYMFWKADRDTVPADAECLSAVEWWWEQAVAKARECHAFYGVAVVVEAGELHFELEDDRTIRPPVPVFGGDTLQCECCGKVVAVADAQRCRECGRKTCGGPDCFHRGRFCFTSCRVCSGWLWGEGYVPAEELVGAR